MEIRYNVTGAKRKELVKVIANATGARAEYKFMPTCNYEIDYFTVTKDGTLLLTTVPTARKSSGCWKPSPPPALNVSRRTAVSSFGRNQGSGRSRRQRATGGEFKGSPANQSVCWGKDEQRSE